ncbi:MAG: DNA polymerase III subunit gamma/tau, partial [Bacteroidetes bacterium]|nr:DNA polymerase III subunit gamma/tau [Bacteroidota bacterium]
MDKYIVSARKYRPSTFSDVVGQSSISTTLKNSILNHHLGHAYLFSGPRGVGKTTCARIFARTINCSNITEAGEACNECESCLSFNENRSYSIHELDAASNNSVDDIRMLTEKVRIPPQIGSYSIYIIDEVHMLSQQAFNAFLKTLEEPPAHAVFILATTEKHKIIPTILSRCQIFDFNRIGVEDAVAHLKSIAEKESLAYEEDALHVVAQKADGAMRDALSIFDQVVSFSGDTITYQNVIKNLNILDYEYFFRLTFSALEGNAPSMLLLFNEVLGKGFDARNFINGYAAHLRDLMVCKDPETVGLMEVGAGIREKYLSQSKQVPLPFLYEGLDICNQADIQFRASRNQRLTIELALVKLANLSGEQKKKKQLAEAAPPPPVTKKTPPP